VTFEGIAGSVTSHIAIDDVSITSGKCQENTVTPALPTTSASSSVNATILSVQHLISTTETTDKSDEKPKSKLPIIIGASVGGAILIVILITIVLHFKGRKR